MHGKFGLISDM